MSLKNLLDLRKKVQPQIQIVEKIIFQKRSWKKEIFRTFAIILTASAVIWGISNAQTFVEFVTAPSEPENFSAIGTVSDITDTTISIGDSADSGGFFQNSRTFNAETVKKVETQNYTPLTLSNIKLGDKIIVQGTQQGGDISISRIVSFSTDVPEKVATSTDEMATSTATTTEVEATTTEASSTATTTDEATTSTQIATTTEETTSTSSPTIVDKVVQVVKDVVNTVVDVVTGSSTTDQAPTETLPAQTTDTPPAPSAPADQPVTTTP